MPSAHRSLLHIVRLSPAKVLQKVFELKVQGSQINVFTHKDCIYEKIRTVKDEFEK